MKHIIWNETIFPSFLAHSSVFLFKSGSINNSVFESTWLMIPFMAVRLTRILEKDFDYKRLGMNLVEVKPCFGIAIIL
jgi:hypothetical protein